MGGSMGRWVSAGARVVHLVLVCGGYTNSAGKSLTQEARVDDASTAADSLGCDLLVYLDVPENHGPEHIGDMVSEIDHWLKVLEPDEVYTCLPWFNHDHDAVHKATLAAMRRHFSSRFWAYEMPQQGLGYQMPEFGWQYAPLDEPHMKTKASAIYAYEPTQQLYSRAGALSWRGVSALARMRGSEVGVEYAERFLLLRG